MYRLLLYVAAICALALTAVAQAPRATFVLVTYEGVSIDQIVRWQIPEFDALINRGALGLMNNKARGSQVYEHVAVTLSAGTRARGAAYGSPWRPYARNGRNAQERIGSEPAWQVFQRNTGVRVPVTAVVQPGIALLRQSNPSSQYPIIPGMLGEQLRRAGVPVAVYGNSDYGTTISRNAVSVAMNRDGWVPRGDVGARTLLDDPMRPFRVRTNYPYLLQAVTALPAGANFVVIEAGDGRRLDLYRANMTPERYRAMHRQCAQELGQFLLQLDESLRASRAPYQLCLAIVRPDATAAKRSDMLTPVLMTGSAISHGLLTSASTRRPGILINIDLPATVLHAFGIQPDPSMLGAAVTVAPAGETPRTLQTMNRQIIGTYLARPLVIRCYIGVLAVGVLLAIAAMAQYRKSGSRLSQFLPPVVPRVMLFMLMLGPLALLVAPAFYIHTGWPALAFIICFSLTGACLLHLVFRDLRAIFAVMGLCISAIICADLLNGSWLLQRSILGYDAITGIRFYGIGNEFAGVLLGSMLLGLFAMLDLLARYRLPLLALITLYSLTVFFVDGSPRYGADFGGMLALLGGTAVGVARVYGGKAWKRWLALLSLGAIMLVVLLVVVNLSQDASHQTHVGRAFNTALHHDPHILLDIAARKLRMNVHLIHSSNWALALVSFIIGTIYLLFRQLLVIRQCLVNRTILNAGFWGMLVGLIIGLLTNDSGVVMAATGLIYLVPPMVALALEAAMTQQAQDARQPVLAVGECDISG